MKPIYDQFSTSDVEEKKDEFGFSDLMNSKDGSGKDSKIDILKVVYDQLVAKIQYQEESNQKLLKEINCSLQDAVKEHLSDQTKYNTKQINLDKFRMSDKICPNSDNTCLVIELPSIEYE